MLSCAATVLIAVAGLPGSGAQAVPATGGARSVVVTGDPGRQAEVRAAVERLGGNVTRDLGIVNGVAASVPRAALRRLEASAGVRAVGPDRRGTLQSVDPTLGYDLTGDDGSTYKISTLTGADGAWTKGWTGKGVDVALVDSGVAPVPGLTSGNVVNGPDLSFESTQPNLRYLDTFGHGTHLASIIAGRDAVSTGPDYARATAGRFTGIAPDARLLSLKVAASDGGCDVSQVIAAIDWVVQHARDPGWSIRVLNLAYGADSTQAPGLDPLAYAVENAWKAGITVVVSSGNEGTTRADLASPAIDPLVIAVGADDPMGKKGVNKDQVPAWAQRGTNARTVDLIAPSVHVLGLRVPGGALDQAVPSARVGSRFFRGSGTSQAAAVVSGLAALYLQANPSATPDQVKAALTSTAKLPKEVRKQHGGYGVPDVANAIKKVPAVTPPAGVATGTGSLEGARGSVHVDDGSAALTGERDIFGRPWTPSTWTAASRAHAAWSGGSWNGSVWTGSGWTGTSWSGASWGSVAWTGDDWSSHAWTSHAWTSHAWTSGGWDSHAWTDGAWVSHAWTGTSWGSHTWSTFDWS